MSLEVEFIKIHKRLDIIEAYMKEDRRSLYSFKQAIHSLQKHNVKLRAENLKLRKENRELTTALGQ